MEFGELIYNFGLFLFTFGFGWMFGRWGYICEIEKEEKKKVEE